MDLFFSGWSGLWRTVVLGLLSYVSLVLFLRISGKRTLSKMNAFDLVVTVALGSTLATILLNKQVALAEGLLALLLLIGLQFCVTWGAVRSSRLESLVKNEPALLLHQGEFLRGAMLHERVTESEIRAAVRGRGFPDIEARLSVILETDGTFSVVVHRAHDQSLDIPEAT
jgi:uncharacterized membrane protein YcaP (DUF421 family)